MLVRSYTADNLQQALAMVKADLGENATIVSSKRVRDGLLSSKLEVTATLPSGRISERLAAASLREKVRSSRISKPAPPQEQSAFSFKEMNRAVLPLRRELKRLREELSKISQEVSAQKQTQKESPVNTSSLENALEELLTLTHEGSEEMNALRQRLMGAGMSARGSAEIAAAVYSNIRSNNMNELTGIPVEHLAVSELQSRLMCVDAVEKLSAQRIALVGPAGSGKTTTIAKIATRAALLHGRSVALIGYDNERIGAAETVKVLAQTIGLPFRQAHSSSQLGHAFSTFAEKSLILVDTSGYSPRRRNELGELGQILASHQCEAHMILSADIRDLDMESAISSYQLLAPKSLSISKVDQAMGLGSIYDATNHSQLPLMYLCGGRQIPNDIEQATSSRAASLIMGLHFN